MGAVPSRESTSLFSYFRGSYEVGMVPLTKFYFGRDTSSPSTPSNNARERLRRQLRQQLLLMRRDPAVVYANARELENILSSVAQPAEEPPSGTARDGSGAKAAAASAATLDRDGHPGCAAKRLRQEYWDVMPQENFTDGDLDRFLELVEETLFDTNEDLLAADPLHDLSCEGQQSAADRSSGTGSGSGNGNGGGGAAAAAAARRPFLPVPCALCLAYPDGKERDGAFALDGRVVNIIGYFGLMTPAMQDAFKVVKRVPSALEKTETETETAEEERSDPRVYLNTAILTSAGDRTLERVLVLAAVMLRQQFHTIGRRHLLQAKLAELQRRPPAQLPETDAQMLHYLRSVLAIPQTTNGALGSTGVRADGVHLPFYDPLLEVPLPSIPRGIYKPTHYINAASNDPPRRPSSMNSGSRASYGGSMPDGSLTATAMAANTSSASTGAGYGGSHTLLYPQNGGLVGGPFLNGASPLSPSGGGAVPGSLAESAASPLLLIPGSIAANSQGSPSGSYAGAANGTGGNPAAALLLHPSGPPALPLDQADEDAVTLAFCRRMEHLHVCIETASNNYSALKSLTENFAFLHCQIVLEESLTKMELIDLPALAETPSFKPQPAATRAVNTLQAGKGEQEEEAGAAADGNDGTHHSNTTSPQAAAALTRTPLSPHSAVVIKLAPQLVRQAAMWASSFFHCPTRLPTGSWVKYKLKDECDQLRHVLQNKDMLIAHWRKTDADRAARYLGEHTGRLLEHVRALQAETEEARALPAEHWTHSPLFVNQDGRKYALFQSRYGTMLIGVRAFAGSPGGSSSVHPGDRSITTTTATTATAAAASAIHSGPPPSHADSAGVFGGSLSGYSSSLGPHHHHHQQLPPHSSHGSSKTEMMLHGSTTSSHTRAGGMAASHTSTGGNAAAAAAAAARLHGSQTGYPYYTGPSVNGHGGYQAAAAAAAAGFIPAYMAPPPTSDPRYSNGAASSPNGYYVGGSRPVMVGQHGSFGALMSGGHEVPAYYAAPPPPPPPPPPHPSATVLMSGGSYPGAAYAAVPMPYMRPSPSSSLTTSMQPGVMYHGSLPPPPPPPPPPPHATHHHNHHHGSLPSTGSIPAYGEAGRPVMLSAAVSAEEAGQRRSANVLPIASKTRSPTSNKSPAFFGFPQTGSAAAQQPADTNTPSATGTPLWHVTTPAPLPPAAAAASAGGGVDEHGKPLHVTSAAPGTPASLLALGAAAGSPAKADSSSIGVDGGDGREAVWATAGDPHAYGFNAPPSLPRELLQDAPTTSAAAAVAAASSLIPLFSAHSIWGPEESSAATVMAIGCQAVSTTSAPKSSTTSFVGVAGDSLTQLSKSGPRSGTAAANNNNINNSGSSRSGPQPLHRSLTGREPYSSGHREEKEKEASSEDDDDDAEAAFADPHAALTSLLPWSLKPVEGLGSGEDVAGATPHYLLRGTDMLDVDDDEDEEGEGKGSNSSRGSEGHRLSLDLSLEGFSAPRAAFMPPPHAVTAASLAGKMATNHTQPHPLQQQQQQQSLSERPELAVMAGSHATTTTTPNGSQLGQSGSDRPHSSPASAPPSHTANAVFPLYVVDPAQQQQQQQQQKHSPPQLHRPAGQATPPSFPGHPTAPAPGQLLYYTVANGVPMLVQPPSAAGGVAMAFPLSGPVASTDPHLQSYATTVAAGGGGMPLLPHGGGPYAMPVELTAPPPHASKTVR